MGLGDEKKCYNCVWFRRLDNIYGMCGKHNEKVTQWQTCQSFRKK